MLPTCDEDVFDDSPEMERAGGWIISSHAATRPTNGVHDVRVLWLWAGLEYSLVLSFRGRCRMSWIPQSAQALLSTALVCELTVVGRQGQPVTHPLIPLWDGERVYMTSSVLFSKKIEHIKRTAKVSLSITDPVATPKNWFLNHADFFEFVSRAGA